MKLHWRDLETPIEGEWHGLELTVQGAARPGFGVSVCPPYCIRIATGAGPVVWARISDDYYSYELLRSSTHRSPGVLAPISFRTVEENARDDSEAFFRAWARTFASMLAQSEASPLFAGRWYLGHDLEASNHRELGTDLLRKVVQQDTYGYVSWDIRAPYPIALRDLSPHDHGRVHAWRKHARAGSLPPVLCYWISGLCAHVILDGHDRALAAFLENVPAPVLFLGALRGSQVPGGSEAVFETVGHISAARETDARRGRDSITVENANRVLLNAFAPRLVAAPTRAMALSGGMAAWWLEVNRELALQNLADTTLIDGLEPPRNH